MTSNNCAIFKVFLKTDSTTEVRKFVIDDASVITSFVFIQEKLQSIFPKLRESYFRITWKDSDGDDVIIDSDEDLILAFTEMDGPVKTLYVTAASGNKHHQQFNPSNFAHPSPNIVCDVCNNNITTYRYKCLQCFDYDLCGACEHAGHHSHHMMIRSSTPELPFSRCSRKVFDHFNKAVKKVNHMANRECKRKSKWDDKKFRHEKSDNANGEGTSKQQDQTSCPFEEMGNVHFYPFIDAISNAANAAASVAANAAAVASASVSAQTQNPNEQKQSQTNAPPSAEENPTNQFIELVRNALNNVFVIPPHQQSETANTNSQPRTDNVPPQNQNNSASNAPSTPNAPMESEVDLTAETIATTSMAPNREPGWTILSNEEQVSQSQYPILQPTVAAPPEPQDPVIAVGLQQLLDMGFSNREALTALLKRYNGNLHEVVKHIFENQ